MLAVGNDFEQEAAEAIQGLGARLRGVRPAGVNSLELPALLPELKADLIAQFASDLSCSKTAIYAIGLPDADPADIHVALGNARNGQVDGRSYSRVLPLPAAPANTLYVGSSRNLQKRLMEHLGFGAKKTYSLHMLHWAGHLGRIVIDVRFYPADIDNDLLCTLEDHWAGQQVPLFGKRGSV